MELVDFDLAEADIKKALEIDPDNRYLSTAKCWLCQEYVFFFFLNIVYRICYFYDLSQLIVIASYLYVWWHVSQVGIYLAQMFQVNMCFFALEMLQK